MVVQWDKSAFGGFGNMEGYFADRAATDRPWQGDLCQYFTREEVARICLRQLSLPRDLLASDYSGPRPVTARSSFRNRGDLCAGVSSAPVMGRSTAGDPGFRN